MTSTRLAPFSLVGAIYGANLLPIRQLLRSGDPGGARSIHRFSIIDQDSLALYVHTLL